MKENTHQPKQKMNITDQLRGISHIFIRYAAVLFIVLLVGVYTFLVFQILAARNATPSTDDVTAKLQGVTTPHIDPGVVGEIQSLQDNSVNVKTLFDQARSNPFQE
jgi:hypothetical protein